MTMLPPTPYTTAVIIAASSVIATKNTCPYMAVTTPMSRTLAALLENSSDSSRGRPNSLTSIAPATLNRSFIIEPISASSCMDSLESRCMRRPSRRAGKMNSGISASAMTLTSHDR